MPVREPYLTRARFVRVLGVLALVLVAAVVGSALVGSERIDVLRALRDGADSVDGLILLRIRLPRALLAESGRIGDVGSELTELEHSLHGDGEQRADPLILRSQ